MNNTLCSFMYTLTFTGAGFILTVSGFIDLNYLDVDAAISYIGNSIQTLQNPDGFKSLEIAMKDMKIIKPSYINNTIDIYKGCNITLNKGKLYFIYNDIFNYHIRLAYIMPLIGIIVQLLLKKLNFTSLYSKCYHSFKSGLNFLNDKYSLVNFSFINTVSNNLDFRIFMFTSSSSNNPNDDDNDRKRKQKISKEKTKERNKKREENKELEAEILRLIMGVSDLMIRLNTALANLARYSSEWDATFNLANNSREVRLNRPLNTEQSVRVINTMQALDQEVARINREVTQWLGEMNYLTLLNPDHIFLLANYNRLKARLSNLYDNYGRYLPV